MTYDTGGSCEIVSELDMGRVISKGDVNAALTYIDYYANNPTGDNKIRMCRERLSETRMINCYVELFEKYKVGLATINGT